MHRDGSPDLGLVLADPRRVADLHADDIPALLGALEEVRATLWSRMLRAPAPIARDPDGTAGDQLLTVAEVAAELRFTRGYVYDAVRRGQLSALRTGKYVRIRRAALTAWLDGSPAIALDRNGEPSHSVRLTAGRRVQPVSHRPHPPPPGRGPKTKSPGARRVEASAATAQRTDD